MKKTEDNYERALGELYSLLQTTLDDLTIEANEIWKRSGVPNALPGSRVGNSSYPHMFWWMLMEYAGRCNGRMSDAQHEWMTGVLPLDIDAEGFDPDKDYYEGMYPLDGIEAVFSSRYPA